MLATSIQARAFCWFSSIQHHLTAKSTGLSVEGHYQALRDHASSVNWYCPYAECCPARMPLKSAIQGDETEAFWPPNEPSAKLGRSPRS